MPVSQRQDCKTNTANASLPPRPQTGRDSRGGRKVARKSGRGPPQYGTRVNILQHGEGGGCSVAHGRYAESGQKPIPGFYLNSTCCGSPSRAPVPGAGQGFKRRSNGPQGRAGGAGLTCPNTVRRLAYKGLFGWAGRPISIFCAIIVVEKTNIELFTDRNCA
jgi:hypothetical protein